MCDVYDVFQECPKCHVTIEKDGGCNHMVCNVCDVFQECPKCHVTIEKDGGCNHMVCKNQNCKADFCWVCLGPWEPHGSSWSVCVPLEIATVSSPNIHHSLCVRVCVCVCVCVCDGTNTLVFLQSTSQS